MSGTGENLFFCDPASFSQEDMYTPCKIYRADLEKNALLLFEKLCKISVVLSIHSPINM